MCVVYLPNDALDELDENLMKNIISVDRSFFVEFSELKTKKWRTQTNLLKLYSFLYSGPWQLYLGSVPKYKVHLGSEQTIPCVLR